MYKIVWENGHTNAITIEYGFRRKYIAKRVNYLLDEDYTYIKGVFHLQWSLRTLIKCLRKEVKVIKSAKNF